MKLITDYAQYYDGLFNGAGPEFHRMAFTQGGLSKPHQFALFQQLGLKTPPHGVVSELIRLMEYKGRWGGWPDAWREHWACIVYLDPYAHGGKGKERMKLADALRLHPTAFASVFVPPLEAAVNFRHVRIGRIGVWLQQTGGSGEWRSNRHDQERILRKTWDPEPSGIARVMWAIDFVPSPEGLLAVDFNTAPELSTLGETGSASADEIRGELEWAATETPAHLRQF